MQKVTEIGHFVILKFELQEYSRKIEKTIMKNQPKFEIFWKYIEKSGWLEGAVRNDHFGGQIQHF